MRETTTDVIDIRMMRIVGPMAIKVKHHVFAYRMQMSKHARENGITEKASYPVLCVSISCNARVTTDSGVIIMDSRHGSNALGSISPCNKNGSCF